MPVSLEPIAPRLMRITAAAAFPDEGAPAREAAVRRASSRVPVYAGYTPIPAIERLTDTPIVHAQFPSVLHPHPVKNTHIVGGEVFVELDLDVWDVIPLDLVLVVPRASSRATSL